MRPVVEFRSVLKIPKNCVDEYRLKYDLEVSNGAFWSKNALGLKTDEEPTVILWKEDDEFFYTPRHYDPPYLEGVEPIVVDYTPFVIGVGAPCKYSPRNDIQVAAADALMADSADKFLCLACGAGKSFVACYAASTGKKLPMLVVVHTKALMDQWKDRLQEYLEIRPEEVGHVQSSVCDYKGKKVAVAMLHSLAMRDYGKEFYDYWRLVVYDECLVAGTMVGNKKVEDIQVGDVVPAYDEFDGSIKPGVVSHVFVNRYNGSMVTIRTGGRTLTCTGNHPVLTDSGWKRADAVYEGDSVLCYEEGRSEWTSVESCSSYEHDREYGRSPREITVYNLEIEKYGTYVANGIVVHNCHRVSAPWFNKACTLFQAERWGLTATLRRSDNLESTLLPHFDGVCYENMEQELAPKVFFVNTKLQYDTSKYLMRNGQLNLAKLVNHITDNNARNLYIAKNIEKAYNNGRTILILGERISQIHDLHQLTNVESKSIHIGSMSQAERKEALTARVVFASQQLAKEGLDRPAFDTLMILIPFGGEGRLQQSVGRILRTHGSKKEPYVIIFVDDCSVMISISRKMRKWFIREGYQISNVNAEIL